MQKLGVFEPEQLEVIINEPQYNYKKTLRKQW